MDRSVTPKMLYGPQLRFGLYNILGVTDRLTNCHMTLSAMRCLLIMVLINGCFQNGLVIGPRLVIMAQGRLYRTEATPRPIQPSEGHYDLTEDI